MTAIDHVPDARDGLTAIERAVLRTARPLSMAREPSRDVVGAAQGTLPEHRPADLYAALVRLAQPFRTRYPLIEFDGALGSIDGEPAAASRATQVRRSAAGVALAGGAASVTTAGRQDPLAARVQPTSVLPGPFPALLANGSWEGIAQLPPHNLGEVVAALTARLNDPGIDLDGILALLPGPDYPTGGVLVDPAEARAAYATGRGELRVRAALHREPRAGSGGPESGAPFAGAEQLVVTELPYLADKGGAQGVVASLRAAVRERSVRGVAEIIDESDWRGLRIVIEVRSRVDVDELIEELFAETALQSRVPVLLVTLDGGTPKQRTLLELIDDYLAHQMSVRRARGLLGDDAIRDAIAADLAAMAGRFADPRRTAVGVRAG